jgi:hypothetical protein
LLPGARGAELRHELHKRGVRYGARRACFLLLHPYDGRDAHKLDNLRGVLSETPRELLVRVQNRPEQNALLFEGCALRGDEKRKHPLVSRVGGRKLDA